MITFDTYIDGGMYLLNLQYTIIRMIEVTMIVHTCVMLTGVLLVFHIQDTFCGASKTALV